MASSLQSRQTVPRRRTSSNVDIQSLTNNAQTVSSPPLKSIWSSPWMGFGVFVAVLLSMIYYTSYYMPLHADYEQYLHEIIDNGESAPFGLDEYPFDTPYDFRDVAQYGYTHIIAIGDLHGDLAQTHKLLQLCGILDAQLQFVARNTIIVQTGDIVDRRSDSIEIYKLFFDLRAKAAARNSLVLQILGNHELMNLGGDYRYVHSNELAKYGSITQWHSIWSMRHKIGYFLRNTPIIRVIGNTLFVHAGLRPQILTVVNEASNATNELNAMVRNALTMDAGAAPLNVMDPMYGNYLTLTGQNGPMWTREFEPRHYNRKMLKSAQKHYETKMAGGSDAESEDSADSMTVIDEYLCKQLKDTLNALNVKRMVIGHNVQHGGAPIVRCDGTLYSIDVGISCAYGCNLAAISIDIESDLVSLITP